MVDSTPTFLLQEGTNDANTNTFWNASLDLLHHQARLATPKSQCISINARKCGILLTMCERNVSKEGVFVSEKKTPSEIQIRQY